LRLITPKSRYRTHSQCSNIPWFRRREEHALWMHPQDAATRGIRDGQPAIILNERGKVRMPARVTEEIMAGVVCMIEGIWPEFDAEGIDTAGSSNVLTPTEPTLPSQGTRTHSVLVEVTPA
jgi:anaerobic dimethyl sulfoxide reductase subunit A